MLFVRDHRQVELTAAGAPFAERGRRLLTGAEDMLTAVSAAVPVVRLDPVTEGSPLSVRAAQPRFNCDPACLRPPTPSPASPRSG
jgi:hypothetical protein